MNFKKLNIIFMVSMDATNESSAIWSRDFKFYIKIYG